MSYRIYSDGTAVRLSDGHDFALNAADPSYAEYYTWLAAGNTPEHATTPSKKELRAYLAAKRYEKEIGGFLSQTFGPLDTSRESQAMIARTIQSIDLGLVTPPINYKSPAGFVQLDRSSLVAIGTEVAAHVQSVFDAEMSAIAAIENGTLTTFAEIEAVI